MNDNILIVDIETTGFSNNDFIIEVGIVTLDIVSGKILPLLDVLTWEKGITREIIDNSWIANNSTITSDAIYNNGIQFQKLIPTIQNLINMFPLGITAFNNVFDFRFLENRGLCLNTKLDCPMKVATDIIKLPHQKRAGFKYPNVEEAYNYYFPEKPYKELHRGLDDAIHEAKIIYEMIKRGEFVVPRLIT